MLMKINSYIEILFLRPVAFLVSLVTGINFEPIEGIGFVSEEVGIVISKACSGTNFFILMFFMLLILCSHKNKRRRYLVFNLGLSYVVTLMANSSRIILAISFMRLNILKAEVYERLIHEIIGIVVYFTFVLVIYCFFNKRGFEEKRGKNAEDL